MSSKMLVEIIHTQKQSLTKKQSQINPTNWHCSLQYTG